MSIIQKYLKLCSDSRYKIGKICNTSYAILYNTSADFKARQKKMQICSLKT